MLTADNLRKLSPELSFGALAFYLVVGLVLIGFGGIWLYDHGRTNLLLAALLAPAAILIVTTPRWALGLFIGSLFVVKLLLPTGPVLIVDVAGMLIVTAAVIDLLLHDSGSMHWPPLTAAFGLLLIALVITGTVAAEPIRALRPLLRLTYLFVVFASVYHLSTLVGINRLLRWFFWFAVANAIVAIVPFVLSGGTVRSFGLAVKYLDELMMLALPVGLSLYLWANKGKSFRYGAGTLLIFLALLATQSRAPILLAIFAVATVTFIAYRRPEGYSRRTCTANTCEPATVSQRQVRRRIYLLLAGLVFGIVGVAVFHADLFSSMAGRFVRLFTTHPGGTVALRLRLWGLAWQAFIDYPLFGIGPGTFRYLQEIYPTVHISSLHQYTRGLSAHNLTLHYLAETGIIGAGALLILFVGQFRLALKSWRAARRRSSPAVATGMLAVSLLLLLSTLLEAGWMWGHLSLVAGFWLGLIARFGKNELSAVER
ncbi:MAG: O-antigen ligase family protein [Candidatus Zixiibacteriota bacterium]|nr:MAG: O-antigen ligase family protein [candidate division Zixibacteria bacterium]